MRSWVTNVNFHHTTWLHALSDQEANVYCSLATPGNWPGDCRALQMARKVASGGCYHIYKKILIHCNGPQRGWHGFILPMWRGLRVSAWSHLKLEQENYSNSTKTMLNPRDWMMSRCYPHTYFEKATSITPQKWLQAARQAGPSYRSAKGSELIRAFFSNSKSKLLTWNNSEGTSKISISMSNTNEIYTFFSAAYTTPFLGPRVLQQTIATYSIKILYIFSH